MIAILRHLRPELASIAVAVAGVLIFGYVIKGISPFVSFLKTAASETGSEGYFLLMLKAMAISLCCRMSADICRDCGENGLASRVELAGKFGIVLISLPIVRALFEIAKDMLG
jgi:stage III sporulation protein AD